MKAPVSDSDSGAVGMPYFTLKRAVARLYEPPRGKKKTTSRRKK